MAALWTAHDAAAATGGAAAAPADTGWLASGVAIDSRAIAADDLFVALKGPNFDGHDFVAQSLGAGAAAALVSHTPDDLPNGAPLLLVADTMAALEALGRAARARSSARICAITGSVGKTGTKEALRLALSGQAATTANLGSLNNHWGVPLSLARLAADSAFGIFEIGMNHPGEIAPLSRMIRPHVAIVTTIEAAHTEFFSSIEEIADATGIENIIGFGAHPDADARLIDFEAGSDSSRVEADICGLQVTYRIGAPGRHLIVNSLAVLAAIHALGADVERGAARLADYLVPDGRGRLHRVALGRAGFTLIDESYNASPASMRAAAETLGNMQPEPGGRRIAVLGDMRELGASSADLHAALAPVLDAAGIDIVFTAGVETTHLDRALPARMQGGHADSAAELAPMAAAMVKAGDIVTVKGSAAGAMKTVVEALLALGPDRDSAGA